MILGAATKLAHAGSSFEEQKQKLDAIRDFANDICDKVPIKGEGKNVELNGEGKAQVNGLLSKLAHIGGGVSAKSQETEYQNVLQKDLAEQLNNARNCKREIFEALKVSFGLDRPSEDKPPSPSSWQVIAGGTFAKENSGWDIGNRAYKDIRKCDVKVVDGIYRWDAEFGKASEEYVISPYGSAVDFKIAVGVKFKYTSNPILAGIVFGASGNEQYRSELYSFVITSNRTFTLRKYDSSKRSTTALIKDAPLPGNFEPSEWNTMSVVVDQQMISCYINSKLLGQYRDIEFQGGNVGLTVGAYDKGGAAVIDFNNFEFSRKLQ
jgi:hypothetical protein